MYRARHHYTMSDVPTFAHLRAAGRHLRAALGCLLCAVGAVMEWAAGRFDRAGSVLLGEWRPMPSHDPSEYVILDDPEFTMQWHRDPEETDTVVAPALVAVATLADCRAAFTEAAAAPVDVDSVPDGLASEPEPAPEVMPSAAQTTEPPKSARKPSRFKARVNGRTRYFATIEDARQWVGDYHERTGIVLGIEEVKPRKPRRIVDAPPEPPTVASDSHPDQTPDSPEIASPAQSQSVESAPDAADSLRDGFQVVCQRAALVSALTTVQRAIPRRMHAPILSHVRMTAADGRLAILALDFEVYATATLPTEVDTPGVGVVPCRELLKLLKSSREKEVGLVVTGDGCRIIFGESEANLPTLPADEFPDPQTVPADSPTFTVDAGPLVEALDRAAVAADRAATTRFALHGVHIELRGDHVDVVGTDSKRLAVCEVPVTGQSGRPNSLRPSMLLPRSAVDVIRRGIKRGENVAVRFSDRDAEFVTDSLRVYTRQVDGRYPPYRDIINQALKTEAEVLLPVRELLDALSQVATFTDAENRRVELEFAPGKVQLSTTNAEKGLTSLSLALPECTATAKLALDPEHLADYLRSLGKEPTTTLKINGSRPFVLQHNCTSYRYLQMPIVG